MRLKFCLILLFSIVAVSTFSRDEGRTDAFGISVPKSYKIHGIDVSRYQEKINWEEIASATSGNISISFAFIKATEGQTLKDTYFNHNWSETKKHNIKRGAYHYYKPNVNSSLQIKNFTNTVKLKKGDLPPVLDIEETGKHGDDNMRLGITRWLTAVEKHYGVRPIIYTNVAFFRKHLNRDEFKKYHIWLAHYTHERISTDETWMFWQYSDKGVINNIKSKVAFNALNGTLEDLEKLCKK